MEWKEIANSDEVICCQTNSKEISVTIEARQKEDMAWEIYRIYHNGRQCLHIDEYTAETRHHAEELMEKLKSEKMPTRKEIMSYARKSCGGTETKIKRIYKEPFVEKWMLNINNLRDSGFLVVRYGDEIEMDIILNNRLERYEKDILSDINKTLGIKRNIEDIRQNIYYFTRSS